MNIAYRSENQIIQSDRPVFQDDCLAIGGHVMSRVTLDLDALRSFVTGVDLEGYAKAADQLGRSTSAVSAHLKKLEDQAGAPLFRKAGRQLALTEEGQTMLGYARRLLDLNDEALAAV